MRIRFTVAAVGAMLASSTVLLAEGPGRQNPYSNLFTGQLQGSPAPNVTPVPPRPQLPQFVLPQPAGRATVVCGMTVVEGDSKIDANIAHKVPQNGSKAVMTIVEPQICRR